MPLTRVVPLDAMRLLLARIELSNRQEHAVDGVIVRTVQAGTPALQPLEQALTGETLSRSPHSQSTSCPVARSQAFQTQSGSDFFSDSATSRRARLRWPGPPARASGRKRPRTARARPGPWGSRHPGA